MREAGVMLIIKDGLILSISRRDDTTKFGLPGGKLEPGEQPWEAAVRETFEETGVIVDMYSEIFRREERTSSGEIFYTYCYYAVAWSGTPTNSEEGVVTWLTDKELTETHGAFPDYNRATLDAFRLKYPDIIVK
jgi:8-oxo-dGTP pyrophosphatase MutT (NUDIX family)